MRFPLNWSCEYVVAKIRLVLLGDSIPKQEYVSQSQQKACTSPIAGSPFDFSSVRLQKNFRYHITLRYHSSGWTQHPPYRNMSLPTGSRKVSLHTVIPAISDFLRSGLELCYHLTIEFQILCYSHSHTTLLFS